MTANYSDDDGKDSVLRVMYEAEDLRGGPAPMSKPEIFAVIALRQQAALNRGIALLVLHGDLEVTLAEGKTDLDDPDSFVFKKRKVRT